MQAEATACKLKAASKEEDQPVQGQASQSDQTDSSKKSAALFVKCRGGFAHAAFAA